MDKTIAGAGARRASRWSRPRRRADLCKLDNVILTPHALCWTDQCFAGNGAADVAGGARDHAWPRAARRRQQGGAGDTRRLEATLATRGISGSRTTYGPRRAKTLAAAAIVRAGTQKCAEADRLATSRRAKREDEAMNDRERT